LYESKRKSNSLPIPAVWILSIIIPWLKENYDYEVIAMAADVGQGEELEPLKRESYKNRGKQNIY